MSIENQLFEIKESLKQGVELVAVSKTHPVEAIEACYKVGQRIFGESRVQDMAQKYEVLPKDIEWHMIGHLQTNKVKYIAPFVELIQSVDSSRIVEVIQKEALKCDRVIDILWEIYIAQEDTKTGWDFEELVAYIESGVMESMPNVRVRGVMGIASYSDDESRVRGEFETLRGYQQRLSKYYGTEFDQISMGMSGDYPIAMECGATLVRVGSSIFGNRDYSK